MEQIKAQWIHFSLENLVEINCKIFKKLCEIFLFNFSIGFFYRKSAYHDLVYWVWFINKSITSAESKRIYMCPHYDVLKNLIRNARAKYRIRVHTSHTMHILWYCSVVDVFQSLRSYISMAWNGMKTAKPFFIQCNEYETFIFRFWQRQRKDFQSQIMFSWNICEIELHWRQWRRLRWQWRWWCRWLCVNALIKELAVMVLMQK